MSGKIGRPSSFKQETADLICEQVAAGVTMRELTSKPGMPSWATVWRWLQNNESFRAQYARAREDGADYHAERALSAAMGVEGAETATEVAAARLMWDALRWHAGKCAPKRYGDKLAVDANHSGGVELKVVSEFRET